MTDTATPSRPSPLRDHMRLPWVTLFVLAVCIIWGNSLVPGEQSGSMSHGVLLWAQNALAGVRLPYEWLTEFIVRKCAHFTEYLVLGLIGMQAFGAHRKPRCVASIALTCTLLVAVPSLDETIQTFVNGRAGMVRDVLLDCSGALTGVLLTAVMSAWAGRKVSHKARD